MEAYTEISYETADFEVILSFGILNTLLFGV